MEATPRANINLTEEFQNNKWVNYTSYDPETHEHIDFQRHVDIRTFTADFNADFSNTKMTTAVTFYQSILPLIEGNCQFLIARSAFEKEELNLKKITGVRFKIIPTENTEFIIMGLKLILAPIEENLGW